jgi:hypothetical protein
MCRGFFKWNRPGLIFLTCQTLIIFYNEPDHHRKSVNPVRNKCMKTCRKLLKSGAGSLVRFETFSRFRAYWLFTIQGYAFLKPFLHVSWLWPPPSSI